MKTENWKEKSLLLMIIVLLVVILSIVLLDKRTYKTNYNNELQVEKIKYVEETIPTSEWESNLGTSDDDKVPTKEAAIKISNVIFENLKHPKEKSLYEINQIIFDSEKNIWIICYSYKDLETIGNGYNIAINKTTGEIEKVWADE